MNKPISIASMEVADLVLRCGVCYVAEKQFPQFHVAKREAGELHDSMVDAAVLDGWEKRHLVSEQRFQAVCPKCARYIESCVRASGEPLPPFSGASAACPKCGGGNISIKFCDGVPRSCKLNRPIDHMHRACGECHYEWYERTKDGIEATESAAGNAHGVAGMGSEELGSLAAADDASGVRGHGHGAFDLAMD